MKCFTKNISLFLLPFLLLGTSRLFSQQTARSFDGSDPYAKYYLEHLPDDYNPNDGKRYPVLIALHGFGEGGNPSINSTKFLLGTGIPALIDNGTFPSSVTVNGKVFKFIVISPQLNQKNLPWYTPQVDYAVQQVKSIYANKADFQRIYLTGYSGGGAGVYTYPATATVLGNQIAAAVICAGAAWYQNSTEISNIVASGLPIWAFHNDGDPIVRLTSDQSWFYALNAAGINPQMKLTVYPNVNQHDCWTRTYDPGQSNPNNIYQWMLQYSRPNIANPGSTVTPVPIASIPTAVAGNSQVITLSAGSTGSAVIDGSASSDAGGSIISYQWGKLSGPSGDQIISASHARTTINFNNPGNYTYQLTITDNQGNTSASRVIIQVNSSPIPVASIPTAVAGNSQVITLSEGSTGSAVIDGSASSDASGSIISYQWGKLSGPSGDQVINLSQARTTVTFKTTGNYTYQLVITDNQGNTSSSKVGIQVNPAPLPIVSIPTAAAGNDQAITLSSGSTASAVIDGSASSDAGGSIISFKWGKLSGPSGDQVISASQARTDINFIAPGNYTYQLIITDNQGNNSASRLSILVNPAPLPVASIPTAIVGNDQTITLPVNTFILDGKSSKDIGGTITSYLWGKLSGPEGDVISNSDQQKTTVTVTNPGYYTYQLFITDNQGNTSASRLYITVNPGVTPSNSSPTAVAGNDQQITLPGGSFTLDGTASKDDGGAITSYEWGKLSGPAGDQVFSSNKASTMVNVVNAGTYTYQLYITDNQGHSSASRMNVVVSGPQPVNPPLPLPQPILRANSGSEEAIILPGNAQLDASSSNDRNGIITGYQWSKLSGPSGDYIANANQMTTSVNYSQVGSYTYSLSVTDDQGNKSSCQKTVIVYPAGTQESVPVANAGNNQNLTTSDVALLDGSQSYVNYARIIHVSWTKVSGPAGDMIGGNSHLLGSATFINPGTYIYQIYIGDSQGNSGVSTVQINVMPSANQDLRRALLKSSAPELGLLTMHGSGQFNFTEGLSVFPNPVITTTHLQLISSETGIVYVRVFDLSGRIAKEQQINKTLPIVSSEVDLGSLSNGVYIIETTINNNRKSTKVLKY